MFRLRKRSVCLGVTSLLVISSCVFILLDKSNPLVEQPDKFVRNETRSLGIAAEVSETTHLFENTCRYVWVEDVEPSMVRFITQLPPVVCPQNPDEVFDRDDDGSFSRRMTPLRVNCSASELFGGLRASKNKVKEEGRREQINYQQFYVNADVFQLTCFDIYGNVQLVKTYAGIRNRTDPRLLIEGRPTLPQPSKFDKKKMSISILGLDSTARAHFHRSMPKTVEQMRKMGFLTFHGYNKVGDNSAVNLLPILAEQIQEGLHFPFFDDENDVNIARILPYNAKLDPDTFEFLWKKMKKKGCVTMFNDDIMHTSRGLFHYSSKTFKKGFSVPPTDHYYRAYYLQIYTKRRTETKMLLSFLEPLELALMNRAKTCLQGDFLFQHFVDIWYRFLVTYADRCHFSFTFLTSVTHDKPNNIQLIDDVLSDRLKRLEDSGALNNTLLIILGDHGNRVSVMSRSFAGKIEERQPLLAIRPPPGFADAYPEAMQNLRDNTQRFISNFDVHETLLDVTDDRFGTKRPVKRGTSLFEPIPLGRSCVDNNVVRNFCLCMILEPENERSAVNYSAMEMSLSRYLSNFTCVLEKSIKCEKEVDIRVPNEMVRLRMRNKIDLPKHEKPGRPSSFEYIYQNCTAQSTTGDRLNITVQYRFDRRSNYDVIYPPMIVPSSGYCRDRRNAFAYCRCIKEEEGRS
ncbi:hypothetical protein Y032_0036g3294 [Ancylostoma ceylanicum]|uniref:Uncharacterized protein n=1 Tax=Ancylostoma ceylanicum TaxID=53326 RepID=A0A016ULA6_9BILA|nr:hypothetical protein Y032_0036g3294 [Ancylostoma ceylanicum]